MSINTSMYPELSGERLIKNLQIIKKYHEQYLDKFGVKLPSLFDGEDITISCAILCSLVDGHPYNLQIRSKSYFDKMKLEVFGLTGEAQQIRRLIDTTGLNILQGKAAGGKRGDYKLGSLTKPHPTFNSQRRSAVETDFLSIKNQYGNRCANCGSEEGKPNLKDYKTTVLQMGHKNPNLPLTADNIIPQCEFCNRFASNNFIYNNYGIVQGINPQKVPYMINRSAKYSNESEKKLILKTMKVFNENNPEDRISLDDLVGEKII